MIHTDNSIHDDINDNNILIHTDNNVLVHIEHDAEYANTLRRTMIRDVPTLAIDAVNIYSNTSVLIDEIIVHRISLLVINSMSMDDEISFDLDVSFEDSNNLDSSENVLRNYYDVTADMLQPQGYFAHPKAIIVRLYKGEKLKLKAFIKKGTGKEHAKWCPVSVIGYNFDNNRVIMVIESVGGMSSEEILKQAKLLVGNNNSEKLNQYK